MHWRVLGPVVRFGQGQRQSIPDSQYDSRLEQARRRAPLL